MTAMIRQMTGHANVVGRCLVRIDPRPDDHEAHEHRHQQESRQDARNEHARNRLLRDHAVDDQHD
jgi:hypothetical protein